jgi:hypothetical protein
VLQIEKKTCYFFLQKINMLVDPLTSDHRTSSPSSSMTGSTFRSMLLAQPFLLDMSRCRCHMNIHKGKYFTYNHFEYNSCTTMHLNDPMDDEVLIQIISTVRPSCTPKWLCVRQYLSTNHTTVHHLNWVQTSLSISNSLNCDYVHSFHGIKWSQACIDCKMPE